MRTPLPDLVLPTKHSIEEAKTFMDKFVGDYYAGMPKAGDASVWMFGEDWRRCRHLHEINADRHQNRQIILLAAIVNEHHNKHTAPLEDVFPPCVRTVYNIVMDCMINHYLEK